MTFSEEEKKLKEIYSEKITMKLFLSFLRRNEGKCDTCEISFHHSLSILENKYCDIKLKSSYNGLLSDPLYL
jgi:hypothetical protein